MKWVSNIDYTLLKSTVFPSRLPPSQGQQPHIQCRVANPRSCPCIGSSLCRRGSVAGSFSCRCPYTCLTLCLEPLPSGFTDHSNLDSNVSSSERPFSTTLSKIAPHYPPYHQLTSQSALLSLHNPVTTFSYIIYLVICSFLSPQLD